MADARRILLLDIDGKLVSTGGAGAVAWRRAFEELHGIPADIGQFTDAWMPIRTWAPRRSRRCCTARPPPRCT
jgi:hypothetical protein